MKYVQPLLGASFVVAAVFSSAALAAEPATAPGNKADSSKVMPQRTDLQPGAAPSVQSMGENAQRQHDRNAATPKPAPGAAATTNSAQPRGAAPDVGEVRDWAKIDKNKDNLISPEEMETYLNESRAKTQPKS